MRSGCSHVPVFLHDHARTIASITPRCATRPSSIRTPRVPSRRARKWPVSAPRIAASPAKPLSPPHAARSKDLRTSKTPLSGTCMVSQRSLLRLSV